MYIEKYEVLKNIFFMKVRIIMFAILYLFIDDFNYNNVHIIFLIKEVNYNLQPPKVSKDIKKENVYRYKCLQYVYQYTRKHNRINEFIYFFYFFNIKKSKNNGHFIISDFLLNINKC